MNIDWRNRFSWNWISSVRHQGTSQNCWAFAMTALYEAMVRIEHCVWCRRSEGDLARGTGKQKWDLGNLGEASIFAERYGVADPDCFPWSEAASLYLAKPHGITLSALPVSTTPDRVGRTIKVPAVESTTDVAQKKLWIDLVGPMAVMFTPPPDFAGYGGGIYTPAVSGMGIAHALLVVGFNDDDGYWIVKNSYGTSWGEKGFARISYSSNLLEPLSFVGVRNTNPDPWTKRRLRNGNMIESGNGLFHNNFEIFIKRGLKLEHWWREHSVAGFPWNVVGGVRSADPWRDTFHDDALDMPAVVHSTFNRNYEIVYRSTFSQLRHVYYDQAHGWWFDGAVFGPVNPVGVPGFIQSNRGAPRDFEIVVLTNSGELEHWTKHNSFPWTRKPGEWYLKSRFGSNIKLAGPGLIQSKIGATTELESGQGELHYVCVDANQQICHYKSPSTSGKWVLVSKFGNGITSAPCLIEGQFGATDEVDFGNFELCVTKGDEIEHWWCDNHGGGNWVKSAVFGDVVSRVVGLVESSFGFNLELIVERRDGRFQHYWRDGGGWHIGSIIT